VLATTVSAAAGTDAKVLQAYQGPHTTVEPGLRWIKHLAALSPVWPEQLARGADTADRIRLLALTPHWDNTTAE
jgi:hypothetical protein